MKAQNSWQGDINKKKQTQKRKGNFDTALDKGQTNRTGYILAQRILGNNLSNRWKVLEKRNKVIKDEGE